MKTYIKRGFRKIFEIFGWELQKKITQSGYFRNIAMNGAMERMSKLGLGIKTVIDVGAAEGSWSLSALESWQDATYVLFEPLEERKKALEELVKQQPNFHFVPFAAGKDATIINYAVSQDLDGSGIADGVKHDGEIRTITVTSINKEVEKLQLKGPFLVKLDTHGYEVPIIEGCSKIMDNVSLFIIECYGFQIAKDSLLFWEMCEYMASLGFRLIDIIDISLRSKDNAFWQCDAFFIPSNHEIFTSNSFK